MVIYYSATGNSKHVAIKLREAFQGKLVDICNLEEPATFLSTMEIPSGIV